MTTILMLDDEQSEMLTFGLAIALQRQRQGLAEIMQERLQMAADGERNVSEWKMMRFNSLMYRASQLQALIATVDNATNKAGLLNPD